MDIKNSRNVWDGDRMAVGVGAYGSVNVSILFNSITSISPSMLIIYYFIWYIYIYLCYYFCSNFWKANGIVVGIYLDSCNYTLASDNSLTCILFYIQIILFKIYINFIIYLTILSVVWWCAFIRTYRIWCNWGNFYYLAIIIFFV